MRVSKIVTKVTIDVLIKFPVSSLVTDRTAHGGEKRRTAVQVALQLYRHARGRKKRRRNQQIHKVSMALHNSKQTLHTEKANKQVIRQAMKDLKEDCKSKCKTEGKGGVCQTAFFIIQAHRAAEFPRGESARVCKLVTLESPGSGPCHNYIIRP